MICKDCKENLEESDFYFRNDTGKHHRNCKKCLIKRQYYRIKNNLVKHRVEFDFKCINCNVQKTDKDYYVKDKKTHRYDTTCKECRKLGAKKWHQDNREQSLQNKKEWYEGVKDNDDYKERALENVKKWHKYQYYNNSEYKLICLLRYNTLRIIKYGCKKNCKTLEMLGCSVKHCRKWLESQFDNNMTWENHGSCWHIDHFIPISYFDFSIPDQQNKCFHWSNIQPLHKKKNLSKSNKLPSKEEQDNHEIKVNKFLYHQVVKSILPQSKGSD